MKKFHRKYATTEMVVLFQSVRMHQDNYFALGYTNVGVTPSNRDKGDNYLDNDR